MNHIDLFSGIGGFAYAARQVWGDEYHNVLFCDNNKFCQEVIKKNFGKDSVIYGDIRQVTTDAHRDRLQEPGAEQQAGRDRQLLKIDLITGGFPCQPFSQAGKRRGTEDNRYLWPEMLRVISEFKPTWAIAENVRGLLTIEGGLVFEQVCLDLEREGYEVQPFVIPAVAINAPHRRDRVWIVANKQQERLQGGEWAKTPIEKERTSRSTSKCIGDATDTSSNGPHEPKNTESCGEGNDRNTSGENELWQSEGSNPLWAKTTGWNKNWLEIATEFCGVDDGLPAELDGFKYTKAGHRVERLKALGNAIVPQVAVEIMKSIIAGAATVGTVGELLRRT